MRYISTKNQQEFVSVEQAILTGMPKQGGLYVPEYFPVLDKTLFKDKMTYSNHAFQTVLPFFQDSILQADLKNMIQNTFDFPLKLKEINPNKLYSLELFHGPTGAFKDFGAKFLAQCLDRLIPENETLTILTATSGDTGGAVASAFDQHKKVNIVVLYPKGRISDFQEKQLTCWSKNILSLCVDGNFDKCQSLVKSMFLNKELSDQYHLTSANSINIARLFAQMTYYAYTSLNLYQQTNQAVSFIIPTGNMGNGLACYWAKQSGFPIDHIIFATNLNKTIPDFFKTRQFRPGEKSIQTLANAMDVANPSNFERFYQLVYSVNPLNFKENLKKTMSYSISDEEIKETLLKEYQHSQRIWCPHSGIAVRAYTHYIDQSWKDKPWVIVATAHPYKFKEIIEPIIDQKLQPPDQFYPILKKESIKTPVSAHQTEIIACMDRYFK